MAMKKLETQLASHNIFGQFRFIKKDGEIWFVAVDVCKILGIKQATKALKRLKENEKGVTTIHTLGGSQEMLIVNEPGLYRLIFSSRKPEAEKFQDWVYHEVLPSIRKHGYYSVAPKRKSIAQIMNEYFQENHIELTEISLPNGNTALMPVRDIENFQKMKKKYPDFQLQLVHIVE